MRTVRRRGRGEDRERNVKRRGERREDVGGRKQQRRGGKGVDMGGGNRQRFDLVI